MVRGVGTFALRNWERGKFSYQKDVIDRLKGQGKINGLEKIALLTGVTIGRVSRLIGINFDLVESEQKGVVNIAKKVGKQKGFLNVAGDVKMQVQHVVGVNIAKKAGLQIGEIGINTALDAKEQSLITGLNIAKKAGLQKNIFIGNLGYDIDRQYLGFFGLQGSVISDKQMGNGVNISGVVSDYQKQIFGIQLAGLAKNQIQLVGFQGSAGVDKQKQGIGLQLAGFVKGLQKSGFSFGFNFNKFFKKEKI